MTRSMSLRSHSFFHSCSEPGVERGGVPGLFKLLRGRLDPFWPQVAQRLDFDPFEAAQKCPCDPARGCPSQ